MYRKSLCILTASISTLTVTLAVEPARLPETVITARKLSLTSPSVEVLRGEIQQTPGGVGVIDAETYKRGRATTLKDALDYAPGVFVQPRFGAEEARISIRGSGIQRTFHGRGIKLLQDGVPLNLADGGFDFQAVEPLAAKAIEVYRGGNALEYGATTLGGAVNFVSQTGYDAPALTARFEYGSFESYRGQLATGGVAGDLDYYLSLSHSSTDGFREHSQQNSQRAFANIGYKLSPLLETRFYLTYVQTDSELPGNLTKLQLETDPGQAQRVPEFLRTFQPVARFDNVTSNWKRDFELFRLANRTTWEDGDHRVTFHAFWSYKDLDHPILFVIDQLSNDFGVGLRYDYSGELLGHKNRFTLGVAPVWGITEDNRFDNVFGNRGAKFADNRQTSLNFDMFALEQFWITPEWALSAGAQVTYAERKNEDNFPTGPDNSDTQDWWGFSPKVGVLYQPREDVQFYANVSRSFEPASFGELTDAANGGRGLVQLDPQTGTTAEIGTRGRLARFAWDLSYYYSWLEDELLAFQVAPGLTQTVNADKTTHQGVELGFAWDTARGIFTHPAAPTAVIDGKKAIVPTEPEDDRLVLRVAYLWNDFRYDGDPAFGDGLIAGLPEHYLRAELMYEHPCGFYVGPNVEYVPKGYRVDGRGTLFADGYTLLGAKIGWRTGRGISAYFEAKNLTDGNYAATTGVITDAGGLDAAQFLPGDGRGYFFGVEYRW
jgi:iron complex outermembrane receptor protein